MDQNNFLKITKLSVNAAELSVNSAELSANAGGSTSKFFTPHEFSNTALRFRFRHASKSGFKSRSSETSDAVQPEAYHDEPE
jgi:hypothetical protein